MLAVSKTPDTPLTRDPKEDNPPNPRLELDDKVPSVFVLLSAWFSGDK